ncbi:hypothetical protein ACFYY1_42660 [Streptomyces sp. NPDC001890]|uniref:hypothetical protein n=1 Tax=Streptomyces sp. NPDC001890 TaxID=3364620 RepID=UPI0036779270
MRGRTFVHPLSPSAPAVAGVQEVCRSSGLAFVVVQLLVLLVLVVLLVMLVVLVLVVLGFAAACGVTGSVTPQALRMSSEPVPARRSPAR